MTKSQLGHSSRLHLLIPSKVMAWVLVLVFSLEQALWAAPDVIKPLSFDFAQKTPSQSEYPRIHRPRRRRLGVPKGGSHLWVILVQDAHTNESAQIHTAKALKWIFEEEKGFKHIFLEAGEGDESLTALRDKAPSS